MGRRMCGVGARRGFTILEMLVVIAIISVMASLLFPVLMSAREKARQATCASNLRQLGLGIDQYEQDNDDYGPGSPTNASGNGKLGGWGYYTAFGEGQGPAGTQFDVT